MYEVWLDIFLGKIGKYIINFLVSYYYYLIPVVALYGIFLTISSYNLKRIDKKVNLEIINQAKDIIRKNPDIIFLNLKENIDIPWENIVEKNSFFPFISQESDLWVSRTSPSNVHKIIMQNEEKIKLVLERSGTFIFKENKGVRKNLYLDNIHRITRRGK